MQQLIKGFLLGGLVLLSFLTTNAQAPVGDGLRGDYYDGLNFEHFIQTRRDAQLDFAWNREQPLNGVPADYFSVRWTGWLVPPTTGRYVLHVAVDDGVRLWLDGKQLLSEWNGQPLSLFAAPVELQAGRPYRLRLDYCQYTLGARIHLSWEQPWQPAALHSWRTLWGLTEEPLVGRRRQETVPRRYLFSQLPTPPTVSVAPTVPVAAVRPFVAPARRAPARLLPANSRPGSLRRKSQAAGSRPATPPSEATGARSSTDRIAQLVRGQTLTLRTLYFAQGKATLPVGVCASLDTLAQALGRYPSLRLEIQGHTDNQGDSILNRQLSQQRAEAVCRYLAASGIAPDRLRPVGLGGTQPVADNRLPTERPRNRRVVVRPLP